MGVPSTASVPYDVAIVGGGPAGMAAAMWSARYRRKVLLIDAGRRRNRWVTASHGYLGLDGANPETLIHRALRDLHRYKEVDVLHRRRVAHAHARAGRFVLELDDGHTAEALRVVLATGVRDIFPDVAGFERCFGRSIFTCPSCDGYETQDKHVAVVGDSPEMAEFATGLLDWAASVTAIRESPEASSFTDRAREQFAVDDVRGRVTNIDARAGQVRSLELDDGTTVPCDVVFWLMKHEQQSDIARQLGCTISEEGCIVVDEHCQTTTANVFAAGDMTPGPHLVQIAAAEGAQAGIAAAASLRGHGGSPASPPPAPAPDALVESPNDG